MTEAVPAKAMPAWVMRRDLVVVEQERVAAPGLKDGWASAPQFCAIEPILCRERQTFAIETSVRLPFKIAVIGG